MGFAILRGAELSVVPTQSPACQLGVYRKAFSSFIVNIRSGFCSSLIPNDWGAVMDGQASSEGTESVFVLSRSPSPKGSGGGLN